MCQQTKPYLYADNSAIVCVDKDPVVICGHLQSDLNNLSMWFKVNKVSVNCSKTKCILFCGQRSKHKNNVLDLTLNDSPLDQVNEIKYLGLVIDRYLTFEEHVKSICGKITARTKLLWRIHCSIPRSLAPTLYKSLIYPHFLYSNFILDGSNESVKNKLQCHQNAALRAVSNVDMSYPTQRFLTDLEVDSVRTDMIKSSCKFVCKGFFDVEP